MSCSFPYVVILSEELVQLKHRNPLQNFKKNLDEISYSFSVHNIV